MNQEVKLLLVFPQCLIITGHQIKDSLAEPTVYTNKVLLEYSKINHFHNADGAFTLQK